MIKSRARAAARLPLKGGPFNLRRRTQRRELRDRSEASFPKRQRTGAVQNASRIHGRCERAQAFGLRQSSGALGREAALTNAKRSGGLSVQQLAGERLTPPAELHRTA